jgi:hypothetical protein
VFLSSPYGYVDKICSYLFLLSLSPHPTMPTVLQRMADQVVMEHKDLAQIIIRYVGAPKMYHIKYVTTSGKIDFLVKQFFLRN